MGYFDEELLAKDIREVNQGIKAIVVFMEAMAKHKNMDEHDL